MSENVVKRPEDTAESSRAGASKFRFKTNKEPRRSRGERESGSDRERKRRHDESASGPSQSRHRRRDKRTRRVHSPLKDGPNAHSNTHSSDPRGAPYVNPDDAFRESLFDALADDEGASYWEGVYGQPIHVYPNVKEGPEGDLEKMNDEEYATYVRNRMWEKSHQHIVEERQRRDEERRQRKLKREQQLNDFDSMIEAALQRGQRRKVIKNWDQAWKEYTEKWTRLMDRSKNDQTSSNSGSSSLAVIPWPVISGKREDVSKDAVRAFFSKHPPEDLPRLLKMERVQWHPDKMQQRLRGETLDVDSLKFVTAVFQIVDDLWAELRKT